MKTIFTALIVLFLSVMLGMALSAPKAPSKPSKSVEATNTPEQSVRQREWLRSPSGVAYFYECIEGVRYIGTRAHSTKIILAYNGEVCDNSVLTKENT